MKSFRNLNGSVNEYVQILLDGLQSPNYRDYLDLIVMEVSSELYHWDELCWLPNDEEALESMFNICNCNLDEFTQRITSSNYDYHGDFVNLNTFETITYNELCNLYLEELRDPQNEELLCNIITSYKKKLEELSDRDATTIRPTNIRPMPVRRN